LLLFNVFKAFEALDIIIMHVVTMTILKSSLAEWWCMAHSHLHMTSRKWVHSICDESRIQLVYYAYGLEENAATVSYFISLCLQVTYLTITAVR
jgi:hypothetical protein